MLNLVKKELTANVRYMLISLAIFILYIFIFARTDSSAALFVLCVVIFFYTLSTTNLVLDERYKIELLLTTLPIRRKDIVISKYLLILMIYVASFLLYTLIATISRTFGYNGIPGLTLHSAALGLFVLSLFNGIMLPLAFKFGAQATRYVSFILFFVTFFLSSFLSNIDLTGLSNFFQNINAPVTAIIIFVLAGGINLISYNLARTIYEKKDF